MQTVDPVLVFDGIDDYIEIPDSPDFSVATTGQPASQATVAPNQDHLHGGASTFIQTDGSAAVQRVFVALIGHAQSEVYSVTRLRGSALRAILPL